MTLAHPGQAEIFLTGIDAAVLDAQRLANEQLATMPHPDVRTPDGLAQLRTLTSPPPRQTSLTPQDLVVAIDGAQRRIRSFVPPAPARAVMLRFHGGGWAAGAPEDD